MSVRKISRRQILPCKWRWAENEGEREKECVGVNVRGCVRRCERGRESLWRRSGKPNFCEKTKEESKSLRQYLFSSLLSLLFFGLRTKNIFHQLLAFPSFSLFFFTPDEQRLKSRWGKKNQNIFISWLVFLFPQFPGNVLYVLFFEYSNIFMWLIKILCFFQTTQ